LRISRRSFASDEDHLVRSTEAFDPFEDESLARIEEDVSGIDMHIPKDRLSALGDLDVEESHTARTEEFPANETVLADSHRVNPWTSFLHGTLALEDMQLVVLVGRTNAVTAPAHNRGILPVTFHVQVFVDSRHLSLRLVVSHDRWLS
jgi:hypothetical protein